MRERLKQEGREVVQGRIKEFSDAILAKLETLEADIVEAAKVGYQGLRVYEKQYSYSNPDERTASRSFNKRDLKNTEGYKALVEFAKKNKLKLQLEKWNPYTDADGEEEYNGFVIVTISWK